MILNISPVHPKVKRIAGISATRDRALGNFDEGTNIGIVIEKSHIFVNNLKNNFANKRILDEGKKDKQLKCISVSTDGSNIAGKSGVDVFCANPSNELVIHLDPLVKVDQAEAFAIIKSVEVLIEDPSEGR